MMSVYLQRLVRSELEDSKPVIDLFAGASRQEDMGLFIKEVVDEMGTKYLRHRQGRKDSIKPELLSKYEAELREAGDWYRSEIMEYFWRMRRGREVALIEYPLLSHMVSVAMEGKGIPYMFLTKRFENILTIRVAGEWFFDIPLTLENFQKSMDLLGYCLYRPDHAKETLPYIRKRVDYRLARSWKDMAVGGSV